MFVPYTCHYHLTLTHVLLSLDADTHVPLSLDADTHVPLSLDADTRATIT